MEQGSFTLDEYETWCEEQEVEPYKQLIDYSGTTYNQETHQADIHWRIYDGSREEFVGAIPTEFTVAGAVSPEGQVVGGSGYVRLWEVADDLGLSHGDYAVSGAEEDGSGGVALLRRVPDELRGAFPN